MPLFIAGLIFFAALAVVGLIKVLDFTTLFIYKLIKKPEQDGIPRAPDALIKELSKSPEDFWKEVINVSFKGRNKRKVDFSISDIIDHYPITGTVDYRHSEYATVCDCGCGCEVYPGSFWATNETFKKHIQNAIQKETGS